MELTPTARGDQIRMKVHVTGRAFHANRLRKLTSLEASEHQARQILSDLFYFQTTQKVLNDADKALSAARWRVTVFEPIIERLAALEGVLDPVQAFCDVLHHRYMLSHGAGHDVGTDAAIERWLLDGRPGYPLNG